MEKIKVKILAEDGVQIPEYMTDEAAGMDVRAFIKEKINLGMLERAMVPTGIKVEIPFGYEIQVRPRSGLAAKFGVTVINSPGTIDSDYRGEIKILLVNLSKENYVIENGERIAQLVLQKVHKIEFEKINNFEELNETKRSGGGFGHTGK
ncbi:MAG: dUTP diphosphatase [Fusobacteriaceae bacterium]